MKIFTAKFCEVPAKYFFHIFRTSIKNVSSHQTDKVFDKFGCCFVYFNYRHFNGFKSFFQKLLFLAKILAGFFLPHYPPGFFLPRLTIHLLLLLLFFIFIIFIIIYLFYFFIYSNNEILV